MRTRSGEGGMGLSCKRRSKRDDTKTGAVAIAVRAAAGTNACHRGTFMRSLQACIAAMPLCAVGQAANLEMLQLLSGRDALSTQQGREPQHACSLLAVCCCLAAAFAAVG